MIVSFKHKFIFVHNYKCGGTSVKQSLASALGPHDWIVGDPSQTKRLQSSMPEQLKSGKHATLQRIRTVAADFDFSSWTVFMTVRNPFAICESWYAFANDVVARQRVGLEEISEWRDSHVWPPGWPFVSPTIRAFCESTLDGDGFPGFLERSLHWSGPEWRTQSSAIGLAPNSASAPARVLLIDVADLDSRWTLTCQELGFSETPPLIRSNVSRRIDVGWSSADISRVMTHYATDFEVLAPLSGSSWSLPQSK